MSKPTITKCLFPAAGYGTRFLPATKAIPKEMLPILTKPLLQYGVEEAMQAGMLDMVFITGRGKRAIEDHFDISYEIEHQVKNTHKDKYLQGIRQIIDKCTFSYTRQKQMNGLGDAILTGEKLVGNNPFGVILADDLCVDEQMSVLSQMVALYEKHQCSIVALEEVERNQTDKYGIIEGEEIEPNIFAISNMIEKPQPEHAPSNLAIVGRYILTPDIFDFIRNTPKGKGGEIQITDALLSQCQSRTTTSKVIGYKFKGKRFDCGSIDGFVEATNYFYNKKISAN